LDLTLDENQFPYNLDAFTQTQALRYRWFLNGAAQNGNQFTQGFSFSEEGDYRIQLVTTGTDSCTGKAEKTLKLRKRILPALEIPNLVTSTGDLKNDLIEIFQRPFYPDNEISIFNRWGKEIYKAKPYTNDWPPRDIESGTYFYRLVAGGKNYSGWVQVVRE
jgi:gliding motility-associated-like protein